MGWATLGESVAGTSHRSRNVPCQDAFRVRVLDSAGESLLVAVADGAGTASHSDIGASLACDAIVRASEAADDESIFTSEGMIALFEAARQSLLREAERLTIQPRELACTALLGIVGPACGTFAQLGDGAIVVGAGEDYRAVFWPEPVEYANATDFLTDERFKDRVHFVTIAEPVDEIAVFTDGLQRLALDYSTRTPFRPFFRGLFDELRAAKDVEVLVEPFRNFLESDRVNQRTDDDKTLVLAVRQQ
jgi:hypothetical protein